MSLYDDLLASAVKNIDTANVRTADSLAAANYLVQIAQVQATLAVAEAIRNPRSKPSSGGPG